MHSNTSSSHTSSSLSVEPILRNKQELLQPLLRACKPREQWSIGAEAEKFGVDIQTGAPLQYRGSHGIEHILKELIKRYSWSEEAESPNGPVIALTRNRASITLEPGSQLELSGAPYQNIHAIEDEFNAHMLELKPISESMGIAWLGVGFHPFAHSNEFDWVPKARYNIMREYLPTRGTMGLDMMQRTATVQANFDYSSEQDALRKLRVSLKISPIVTAMFANSPFVEGNTTGLVSQRALVWLHMDPDRTGLLPSLWSEQATFATYVEWALDCPMFLFKRNGNVVDNRGQTFRDFFTHGFHGHRPTMSDWEMHLNTMFPEVRLKRTLEVRGADSLPSAYFAALPALWTGILYDGSALREVEQLCETFTHDEWVRIRERIPAEGLRALWRGKPLADLANQLLDIASSGLERRAQLNAFQQDERMYLSKLKTIVAQGLCPGDVLIQQWNQAEPKQRAQCIKMMTI